MQTLLESAKELLKGINLSDDKTEGFITTLEAVVTEQVNKQAKVLAESQIKVIEDEKKALQESLETAKEEAKNTLAEALDSYINDCAEQYLEENKLAIGNGLKAELCESLLGGLGQLFEQHNIVVDESKVDLNKELETALSEAEKELNESENDRLALKKEVDTLKREKILAEHSEGLSQAQIEKLTSLTEAFSMNDSFATNVKRIKDTLFTQSETEKNKEEEILGESVNLDNKTDDVKPDSNENLFSFSF